MSGPSAVTILIKAPNQMVDDQSIQCQRTWTVKELKVHLSNVYPSKPHPEGQKLIYSGKLLSDSAVLSDVLKTYDGHENNTIHLVCSTKENVCGSTVPPAPSKPIEVNVPEPAPSNPWPPVSSSFDPSTYPAFNDATNHDVRRRYPAPFPGPVNNMPYAYNYYTQENMNRHIMWVQQAYMQYMAQYMQMSNGRYYMRDTHEDQPEAPAPPMSEPPPQNAADEEPEEENHVNRDWLEWVYIMSRLIVLLSVVYFYSSPLRFMLVMTVALILFSIDLERWRRRNNSNEGQPTADTSGAPAEEPSNEVNNIQERPHWFAIVWTFLSSFFLSLIPDHRDIP
ncbi:UBQ [Nesidiocoris tenuis]|uniref:UBQ n=1 Tax=Nesidiocoris tenuis TaxID=355587 RepID=A0ABN7AGB6_9HEMI|nr:UBQ [Nesidiocoris tenuis]